MACWRPDSIYKIVKTKTGVVREGYNDYLNTASYFLISLPFECHSEQKLEGMRLPLSGPYVMPKVSNGKS